MNETDTATPTTERLAPTAILGSVPVIGSAVATPSAEAPTEAVAPAKDLTKKLQPGSPEYIDEVCTYHAPTPEQIVRYQAVREAQKAFMQVIVANCPPSADRSDALRQVRSAGWTANSSIALNGRA